MTFHHKIKKAIINANERRRETNTILEEGRKKAKSAALRERIRQMEIIAVEKERIRGRRIIERKRATKQIIPSVVRYLESRGRVRKVAVPTKIKIAKGKKAKKGKIKIVKIKRRKSRRTPSRGFSNDSFGFGDF